MNYRLERVKRFKLFKLFNPLGRPAGSQTLFLQTAKIAPEIEEAERYHQNRKNLLEENKHISQAAQETGNFLVMKVIGHNRQSLKKIKNHADQEKVQGRKLPPLPTGGNKEGKPRQDKTPDDQLGRLPFSQIAGRGYKRAMIWKTAMQHDEVQERDCRKASEGKSGHDPKNHFDDPGRLFPEEFYIFSGETDFFIRLKRHLQIFPEDFFQSLPETGYGAKSIKQDSRDSDRHPPGHGSHDVLYGPPASEREIEQKHHERYERITPS